MNTADVVRRRAHLYGRVQGVGFRYFCREAALAHGVRGWVRNAPDGSVELEAEESPGNVEDFLTHIQHRHPWARVDRLDQSAVSPRRDVDERFEIRF